MSGVKITKDRSAVIMKAIEQLGKRDVLVGIPQSTSSRPGEPINNAEIAYLNTTGSPANNIPARPFLEPGVKQAQPMIVKQLQSGAVSGLTGNVAAAEAALNRAGTLGANSVKRYIGDSSHFAQNAPSTIRLKGSDKPLIAVGEMRRAVTHVLRDKK